jgi:hypothetical protein
VLDSNTQYVYKVDMDGNVVNKAQIPGLIARGDSTGFDNQKNYIRASTVTPGIAVKILGTDSTLSVPNTNYITINYSVSSLAPGWHNFAVTYSPTNIASLYIDGNLITSTTTTSSNAFYKVYNYKNNPQLLVGGLSFKYDTLNDWIEQTSKYKFNGSIADVRLYNTALNIFDIKSIAKVFEINEFSDLSWNINTGTRAYIEEIERFFLHRLPGSKSQYFNIRIKNSQITSDEVKSIIENNIRNAVNNIAPAYTKLHSIIWE